MSTTTTGYRLKCDQEVVLAGSVKNQRVLVKLKAIRLEYYIYDGGLSSSLQLVLFSC